LLSQTGTLITAGATYKYATVKASAIAKTRVDFNPVNQTTPTNPRPIQKNMGSLLTNPRSVGATEYIRTNIKL
jgi:hypothetical protein